jgi:triacylglycerol lipase
MQRFYTQIKTLFINLCYWFLDYVYVIFWEIAGFLRPASTAVYAHKNKGALSIVLIPGIYENWQFMKPVADTLFEQGYNIHIVEGLGYNRGTAEEMAQVVHDYISQNKLKDCILIAHSKGGLIGKYLLSNYRDGPKIKGMISLNTPFAGSKYAYLLPFKTLRIFIPNSLLLSTLAKNHEVNKKIVSIYGLFDPHIPSGSYLEGAKNIQLPTRGHFRIMKDLIVHKQIISSIQYLSRL